MSDMTAKEAGLALGINHQTVIRKAKEIGVGVNWRGRKGYVFTAADLDAIREAQRPTPIPARRRRAS
jgi:hypothetical protein